MNKKNNYFLRSIFRPILNLGYSFDRMYRGYCNWVPSFVTFCNPSKLFDQGLIIIRETFDLCRIQFIVNVECKTKRITASGPLN